MNYKNGLKISLALLILFLHFVVDGVASKLGSERGFNLDVSANIVTPIYFLLLFVLTLFLIYLIAKERDSITVWNLFVFLILFLKVYWLVDQVEKNEYAPYTQTLKKIY